MTRSLRSLRSLVVRTVSRSVLPTSRRHLLAAAITLGVGTTAGGSALSLGGCATSAASAGGTSAAAAPNETGAAASPPASGSAKKSLYDRLGGLPAIDAVVGDFL